jgi:glycosyltransferase involved in cell wall biosynthesis
LTEELVRQGHNVTLFASGDSITSGALVSCCRRALRLDPDVRDAIPHMMVMLDKVLERAHEFDLIHFHTDYFHFPFCRFCSTPMLTTLHGRQDLIDHMPLYGRFSRMPLVSISNAQRAPLPHANFIRTIYHGLPLDLHSARSRAAGGYLAFLGRISPEKGLDRAIAIARAAGMPLKIAAKVDYRDKPYYREILEPLLAQPDIEFVGEINDAAKTEFLNNASALLFPIVWPEPFGLAMIEAMACGTPVLAFDAGSVPEIVENGVTGRVVSTVEEAVRAIPDVVTLDRNAIRSRFEQRFSATGMASEYVRLYRSLVKLGLPGAPRGKRRNGVQRTRSDRSLHEQKRKKDEWTAL